MACGRGSRLSWSRIYDSGHSASASGWRRRACVRGVSEALIAAAVFIDGERVEDVGRKISAGQTLVLNDPRRAQGSGRRSRW